MTVGDRLDERPAGPAPTPAAPAATQPARPTAGGRTDGPLFATATRHRLDRAAVWRKVRQLGQRAGLSQTRLSPHSLRATAVTLLLGGHPADEVDLHAEAA